MAAILFSGAEPFEQIVNILLTEGPQVKSGENCSVSEKMFKDFVIFIHVQLDKGQGQMTPKNLTAAKQLTSLIKHYKFRPLVIHIEKIFQHFPIFSPKAFLVLEMIFKCFYHIWAWHPACSMVWNHLNKLAIPF